MILIERLILMLKNFSVSHFSEEKTEAQKNDLNDFPWFYMVLIDGICI